MRTSFAAFDPAPLLTDLALQSATPERHAATYDSYGKLNALGGHAAVLAASEPRDGFDDWASGFDIHLGVYTQD